MKKLALIFITLSLSCQAFDRPLYLEDSEKIIYYRCMNLEECSNQLQILHNQCNQYGWNDMAGQRMQEIIDCMNYNLGIDY